jgi:universal stress protein A
MQAPNQGQLRTILVVEEFGNSTSPAMQYAQSIAAAEHSALVLLHSIDPVGYAFPENAPEDPAVREELAYFEREMRAQHLPTHDAVETEIVYRRILQAARDHRADLIVLGTHVARPLGRLALGTVASKLLSNAPCPVLCVPATDDLAMPASAQGAEKESDAPVVLG